MEKYALEGHSSQVLAHVTRGSAPETQVVALAITRTLQGTCTIQGGSEPKL